MRETVEKLKNGDPVLALFKDAQEGRKKLGAAFYNLAKVYYDKADLELAEENFLKSMEHAERPKENLSSLKTLGFLIRLASERMDDGKAQGYIKMAEELTKELNASAAHNAEFYFNLGTINTYKGAFRDAKENFLLSYKKSKEENEPELLAKCLLSLASHSFNQKDFDLSLDYLRQLNELLKIIKKSYLQGAMYFLEAKVLTEMGLHTKALDFFQKANAHLQEKKCFNLRGYIFLGRGVVYQRMGQFDKALVFLELAMETGDPKLFKRLSSLVSAEINELNDSSVDIYLDRSNRKIRERTLGVIDFKHRFILLEILFLLAKNAGVHYGKEDLAKAIWKDEYNPLIHDKLIYTSVSRLRKLIEPDADKEEKRKYILRGKDGYTFNPEIKIRFHSEHKAPAIKMIGNVDMSLPV